MAEENKNITDTTASGKLSGKIKGILIAIAIIGLVTAASRAEWIATLISGWSKK